MIDRDRFFAAVRDCLFGGKLSNSQIAGMSAMLDEWERRKLTDLRHLAYILATAYHEVDKTMQPIDEYGGDAYFRRMYDIEGARPAKARELGNIHPGDGALFHGRTFPQLTGRDNYRRMTRLVTMPRFGVDIEKEPDRANELPIAIAIMFEGMLRAESQFGDFTGVALEDYFNDRRDDPINARRTVNGLDCAEKIASHHHQFLAALTGRPAAKRLLLRGVTPGEDVKEVQRALEARGLYRKGIDGDFGDGTYQAVVALQRQSGLDVDGVVGDATRRALGLAA